MSSKVRHIKKKDFIEAQTPGPLQPKLEEEKKRKKEKHQVAYVFSPHKKRHRFEDREKLLASLFRVPCVPFPQPYLIIRRERKRVRINSK